MSIRINIEDYRESRFSKEEWLLVEDREWGKEVGAVIIECDDPAVEKALLKVFTEAASTHAICNDMMFTGCGWRSDASCRRMNVVALSVEDAPESIDSLPEDMKVVRA